MLTLNDIDTYAKLSAAMFERAAEILAFWYRENSAWPDAVDVATGVDGNPCVVIRDEQGCGDGSTYTVELHASLEMFTCADTDLPRVYRNWEPGEYARLKTQWSATALTRREYRLRSMEAAYLARVEAALRSA